MDSSPKEFLNTLVGLSKDLLELKTFQNTLKHQLSDFFVENIKLTQDLKENAYEQYAHLSSSDTVLLQQKYEAAVEAKNAAIEMWQVALQQIESQEELLMGKKSLLESERSEIEKQFITMKNDYLKGLNILSEELSTLRKDLSRAKVALSEKSSELHSHNAKFEAVVKELDWNKNQVFELTEANNQSQNHIKDLKNLLENSNKTLDAFTIELTALKKENSSLTASVSQLKEQNKKFKEEILKIEKDAKNSLIAAQEAILKKKEVVFKEQQYLKQIEVLNSSINVEVQKACMKYKTEMKEIQTEASDRIKNLTSEMQQMHQKIAEKQSMFERANREKQALESKLERLFSECSSSAPIGSSSFDDLCKRLTLTERSRDELELQVSNLEVSIKELRSAKEQEIQFLLEKQLSLRQRTQTLLDDLGKASADRLRFSDEVTKLRKRSYELEQELKSLKSKYSEDISSLQKESSSKCQALSEKLLLDKEHYKSMNAELQHLLQAEFKISNQWKDEIEDLISKSESKIRELLEEISRLKHNHFELIRILHLNNVNIPQQAMHLINNVDSNPS